LDRYPEFVIIRLFICIHLVTALWDIPDASLNLCLLTYSWSVGPHAAPLEDDADDRKPILWIKSMLS